MPTLEEYRAALEATVCRKCVDGNGTGACLVSGDECAVRKFLPQILEVVGSTYDTSTAMYEVQLRSKVCGHCMHQAPDGVCSIRDDVECALDRYFPLIIQVVEEMQERERPRGTP